MRIKSFSYSSENWVLQKIDLQEVNLIVGMNGTGKSNTLFHIDYFIDGIIKESDMTSFSNKSKWNVELNIDDLNIYQYEIHSISKDDEELIKNEKLLLNKKTLIERNKNESKIYSYLTNSFDKVNPPLDTLVIHSRRDTKAYPYAEAIFDWSKNITYLNFTQIDELLIKRYKIFVPEILFKLGKTNQENVLLNFNKIGFNISKLEHRINNGYHHLMVHEKGFKSPLNYQELSEGMLRALCLLVFTEYLISKGESATLLIDDLGEGLDYIRATELGKMLFKLCEENNIQLIATSNDSFLMDVIDIDCWNVLHRKGKVVSSINIVNNPKLFEDFRYTGLSRFDFFSSDYIDSHL